MMTMAMTNMITMTICSESEFLGENCHLSELSEEGEEENQLKVSKFETFLEPFDQFDILPVGEGRQEGRYVGGEQKVDISSQKDQDHDHDLDHEHDDDHDHSSYDGYGP